MNIQNYKVIYQERVYNCVSFQPIELHDGKQPKFLDVWVIDEDGTMKVLHDETWCFQFVAKVSNKNISLE